MAYWWVNHRKTYKQEKEGGYLWSPKKNTNGYRNQFYENMKFALVGDIVFSYANGKINDVGIVKENAISCSKPKELQDFDKEQWSDDGWGIAITWRSFPKSFLPSEHCDMLTSLLPQKYSPWSVKNKGGNQGAYLAKISPDLGHFILNTQPKTWLDDLQSWISDSQLNAEEAQIEAIKQDTSLNETEREALILARRGQGRFRRNLQEIEEGCRLTGIKDSLHLIASHIKPWRDCSSSDERVDGHNGFLLSPNADHLFDKGYISFSNDGDILISSQMDRRNLAFLGCTSNQKVLGKAFTSKQKEYLAYHRENIFRSE
ncbi:HNH endonuclease [Zymomonas sp.]|uniref:HNH endonuclease n=1 Tax=Zymomonas sp. TaxID=2068624 RepID=UPI0025D6E303|nr:HNH endonuclease [Zymomonas sp.]MCA1955709.1 HNH endonuclease [Zymomonas sp.]